MIMSELSEYAVIIRHSQPRRYRGIGELLLDDAGELRAAYRGAELTSKGYDLRCVAVSEGNARTIQTAKAAQMIVPIGEDIRVRRSQLNEVATNFTRAELRKMFSKNIIPKGYGLYEAGEELVNNLPPEQVSFSHASRIAALLKVIKDIMGDSPELQQSLVVPYLGYVVLHRELKVPPKLFFRPVPEEIFAA